MNQSIRLAWRRPAEAGISILLLLLGLILFGSSDVVARDGPDRLAKQVRIMEKALDEMLVESPNFLVRSGGAVQGIEVEDYGVIFAFEASLTGPWHVSSSSWSGLWPFGRQHNVIMLGDDDHREIVIGKGKRDLRIEDGKVYVRDRKGGEWRRLADDGDDEDEDDDVEVLDEKGWRDRQLRKYERAKTEMVDALMDFGDLLKALPAGQTVRIVANMSDLDLPDDKDVQRLSVRARIDDLRAYGEGRLSPEEMRTKVQVKES